MGLVVVRRGSVVVFGFHYTSFWQRFNKVYPFLGTTQIKTSNSCYPNELCSFANANRG